MKSPPIYSTAQIAEKLGLSIRQVTHLAQNEGIGTKIGPVWSFTGDDLRQLRRRRGVGRPLAAAERSQ